MKNVITLIKFTLVGCVGVHGFGGFWGLMAVGFFKREDNLLEGVGVSADTKGLFHV